MFDITAMCTLEKAGFAVLNYSHMFKVAEHSFAGVMD